MFDKVSGYHVLAVVFLMDIPKALQSIVKGLKLCSLTGVWELENFLALIPSKDVGFGWQFVFSTSVGYNFRKKKLKGK